MFHYPQIFLLLSLYSDPLPSSYSWQPVLLHYSFVFIQCNVNGLIQYLIFFGYQFLSLSIIFAGFICIMLLLFSLYVMSNSFVTPWTVTHQAPLSVVFPRQERKLERVAISFSRGSSQPKDQT